MVFLFSFDEILWIFNQSTSAFSVVGDCSGTISVFIEAQPHTLYKTMQRNKNLKNAVKTNM